MPLSSERPQISDTTPGPALAILAICSAGASAFVAGSAVLYQWRISGKSFLNNAWDIVLMLAVVGGLLLASGLVADDKQVLCITQSSVTALHVESGLGYQLDMLTPDNVTNFVKLEYASNLLYIGALIVLKAVQFLLQRIVTNENPNYWTPSVIMVIMLAFLFTAAFQCSSPFWKLRANQCIDQTAFWIAFGVFDVVSDIYCISAVIWTSTKLQLSMKNRVKFIIILASRFLPVGCGIARLPFVLNAYKSSSNYTIVLYQLGIPTQVQLHLSVMALSLGKIFRFLNSLDVGYLSSSIGPQPGKGSAAKSNAARYAYGSKLSSNHRTKKESISDHDSSKGLVPSGPGYTVTEVEGSIPLEKLQNVSVQEQQPTRGDSLSESMPDAENVIRVTTRFEVRHE